MRKIIITLLAVSLISFLSASEAYSAVKKIKNTTMPKPTLAILDTAIDSSLPIFKDKLIYEACVLEWDTCPNGQSLMEGPGSASMTESMYGKEPFYHGTGMASTALITNPDINIVFVRISGQDQYGNKQPASEKTVVNALFWVFDNKDKFNIKAVSMSQGDHRFATKDPTYCNESTGVEIAVKLLLDYDIPSFFPAGNDSDRSRIDWPACILDSISVGSATRSGLDYYTNSDSKRLDFYTEGSIKAIYPKGEERKIMGTSVATQIAAAKWLDLYAYNPSMNTKSLYKLFYKTSNIIRGYDGAVRLINLKGAING